MARQHSVFDNLVTIIKRQSLSKSKLDAKTKPIMSKAVEFEENFIRREKRRRLETKKEISKMRAELPEYNLNDIRLFKLPFHEALILQLEETGYVHTEAYIKQLFELNERMRNEAGPGSILWNRPILKHSDNELKKLSDALMKAEDQHNKENHRLEIEVFLVAAIDFAFNYVDWFWLAEELILQCLSKACQYQVTGKHEAIARYIYAKMLIELARDYEKAEQELNIVREKSAGKSWNPKAYFPDHSDSCTLFMKANYLLHLCYIRQARHWLKTDQNKTLEFATLAKRRAIEACYHDGETMALFIKGQCELNLGNTKDAVSTFNKAYYIQAKLKSEKGMCEARVELSKAYLMHGSTRLALSTLMALKAMAEEHGFQFYLAQAYRYLGEYYLQCGEPQMATPLLSEALNIFHSTGNMVNADQVRNLGALSSGLELMPYYIGLLQRTDRRCPHWFDNLIKLVKWKDSRQEFIAENTKASVGVSGLELLSQTLRSQGWNESINITSSTVDLHKNAQTQCAEFKELSNIFDPQASETEAPGESDMIVSEEQEIETNDIIYT